MRKLFILIGLFFAISLSGQVVKTSVVYAQPSVNYQNLLLYSEELDRVAGSPYDKSNVTIVANQANDMNSEATLEKGTFTWTTAYWTQTLTLIASTDYVFSFEALNGNTTEVKYGVYDNDHFADIIAATDYTTDINAVSAVRISIPFTTPAGCTSVRVEMVKQSTNSNGTIIYLGRTQVRLSSRPVGYIKTEDVAIP